MSAQFTHPCCHCGHCCSVEVCKVGQHFFGTETPCKGLQLDADGRVFCGLILRCPAFKEIIGADIGCCMKGSVLNEVTRHEIEWASLCPKVKINIATAARAGFIRVMNLKDYSADAAHKS